MKRTIILLLTGLIPGLALGAYIGASYVADEVGRAITGGNIARKYEVALLHHGIEYTFECEGVTNIGKLPIAIMRGREKQGYRSGLWLLVRGSFKHWSATIFSRDEVMSPPQGMVKDPDELTYRACIRDLNAALENRLPKT